jgi:hypothetical protein
MIDVECSRFKDDSAQWHVETYIHAVEYSIAMDHYTDGVPPTEEVLTTLSVLKALLPEQVIEVDKLIDQCFEAGVREGRAQERYGDCDD